MKNQFPFRSILNTHQELPFGYSDLWSPFMWTDEASPRKLDTRNQARKLECEASDYPDRLVLSFDIPGVKREEIKVEVVSKTLSISGERHPEKQVDNGKLLIQERHFGKFERIFELPDFVASDQIRATFTDGVLKITLPKGSPTGAKSIPIGSSDRENA